MQRLIRIALKANDWIIETQYRQYIICKLRYGTFMCRHAWMKAPFIYVGWMYRLVSSIYIERTTRNTVIGCALLEAVLYEPHLKYYQQWLISSCLFQLLRVGLSEVVLHVEPLLIILWIISSSSCSKPLPICELLVAVQNMNRCW
jgi:hypothetical protein